MKVSRAGEEVGYVKLCGKNTTVPLSIALEGNWKYVSTPLTGVGHHVLCNHLHLHSVLMLPFAKDLPEGCFSRSLLCCLDMFKT